MVPIVAGLLMGAALGGGIAALQKKDVLQGALMGGIGGALGGAFMPGAAGSIGAASAEGIGGQALTNVVTDSAISGAGGLGTPEILGGFGQTATVTPTLATASGPGTGGLFSDGIGSFLSNNKYALAGGALGGMMAPGEKPEEADQGNIQTFAFNRKLNPGFGQPGEAYFDDSYEFKGSTPAKGYQPTQFAANGGIIGLADGGDVGYQSLRLDPYGPVIENRYAPNVRPVAPEVDAYNQQLMQRSNQQYNINSPLAPMQVPGMAVNAQPTTASPAAPAASIPTGPKDYIDDYYQQMLGRNADPTGRKAIEEAIGKSWYDPARDIPDVIRKSAEFQQSGKNPNPTGIEIGKTYSPGAPTGQTGIGGLGFDPKTGRYTGTFEAPGSKKNDVQKMREELDALKSEQSRYNDTGGGNAAGGLMRYAMGGNIGSRYPSPDDGAVMDTSNMVGAHQTVNMAPHYPMQYTGTGYASGGHLGDYSDGGRLLKGPGDGVSDDIPAQIGARQPARLADGEFVVPARIVSELGNGSTDAGAKRLYAMMDRVQKNRRKSVGKGKVAVDSKAYRHLPA